MNDKKTYFDEEKTRNQSPSSESTQYDEPQEKAAAAAEGNGNPAPDAGQTTWKTVAVGGVTGILLGVSATLFASATPVEEQGEAPRPESDNGGGTAPQHASAYTEVHFASSVSDDMSFGQAFAAARSEVGSGGAFEWRGNVYSTFTAEEWNGMSDGERADYGSHVQGHAAHHAASPATHTAQTTHGSEEVEVVTAQHDGQHGSQQHNGGLTGQLGGVSPAGDEVDVVGADDSEVQVLGVVHNDETGANIGGMVIDGQEFILVDVDGDQTFDLMGSDLNGDGQFAANEVVDISDQGITVSHLSTDDAFYAQNETEPDYINDADVYDV